MLIDWEKSGRMKASPVEEEVWSEEMEEDDFFRWITDNNKVALHRYQAGNIRGVFRMLDRYKAMLRYASKDPLLSLLETGMANLLTILADHQVDELHFERGMRLYEEAIEVIEEKAARYRARREAPRPESLNWALLLGSIAEAKWKAPEEYRDAILTVHQMIYRYYKTETTVRRNMILMPRDKTQKRSILITLAGTAMSVLRMVMRFAPDRVEELSQRIDEYHGKYFRDETLPFVWGIAITEEYLKGIPDPDTLRSHYETYSELMAKLLGRDSSAAFTDGSNNERDYIMRSCSRSFMLLEG